MKLLSYLRSLRAKYLHRAEVDADTEEELRSHIQLRADDLERGGMERAEAERQARIEFGGRDRFQEECKDALGGTVIEGFLKDVSYSLRVLGKSPGFAIVAVLTLALAIGANAVVFAALNAAVLRSLNVPRAESLYLFQHVSDLGANQSYPDYLDLRDRNRSFEDLAAYNITQAALDTGGNPSRVWLNEVSGNYFDALGIQPYLGRLIHASDERGPNSAPYIVLGHGFWHSHFQDDRGVIGRVVQVNKHPFTVIGVAPPEFHGTLMFFNPDFYLPLVNQEQVDGNNLLNVRGNRWIFMAMGHLKAGVTPEQAAADVNSISADLERSYPKEHHHMTYALARPNLYGDLLGRPVKAFLAALMLLAGLILLAACANLGSLFAARAADRSREVALRLALGASRLRVLRQLFTEAMVVSLLGGAIGLWGSALLLGWLSAWQPFPQYPINLPVSPDGNVYAVALLLALASGFLFGMVPVRQVLRTDPYEIVKSAARSRQGRRITGRDLLVAVQVAICGVLVTSSIVAVRGLVRSMHTDFGFEPRNIMLTNTDLAMSGYRGDAVPAMQKRMLDGVQAIPGVSLAALVDSPPLTANVHDANVFTDETADLRPANAAWRADMFKISPEYLRTAGTSLLSGRDITWHDDKNAPRVAIVNGEFARKMFGSVTRAIGGHYKMADGARIEVVGIVEDGKYENLTENLHAAMFLPLLQSPAGDTWLVVRSDRDPQQLTAAIKGTLHDLDAGLPSFIQSWNHAMDFALFPARVAAVSLGLLGLMGSVLAITGVFGMAAYAVSRRLKELGIRIALGAKPKQLLEAALQRPFKLLAFGSAAGLLLGILASRVLAFVVYQATPRDPVVLAAVILVMSLLGLLATWIPAQRALSVDPLVLLREE